MSGIFDGLGQNQDAGLEIPSLLCKSGVSQQHETEACKVCWKRHKGMQGNPILVLRSETCLLPEKHCIRSSQCLGTSQAHQNGRDERLKDQDSIREKAGSSGAGANAGLSTHDMPFMVKESSTRMPGYGPEEGTHAGGLLLENKAEYYAEKDHVKVMMGDSVSLEMLGDKNKVATFVKLGGIGGQTSRPSEQGLSSGSGGGMHKMQDCVPQKQQADAGCSLVSALGNAEILRNHKLQVNTFDKERAPSEEHEWRQGGDSQNRPAVKHPDTGLSFFELDEARRDMVSQAYDRWSSLGSRQEFLLLAILNDRRQSPNVQSTDLIDAVPVDGPQVPLSSEPESLPLIPGSSEGGIKPPCTSTSHSEERNTIGSTHGQPIMCVTATTCIPAEVVAVTASNINFNRGKSSTLACTGEEECRIETIDKVVPEICQAPAESTSNNLPHWVKPLGNAKKCDGTLQHGTCGTEQHQAFGPDNVVQDCDQVSQVKFFRNGDSSMQGFRHHNSIWISRLSARGLPMGSGYRHYPQVHVGQSNLVGKDRTDDAGTNTKRGGQAGLTMRETHFLISQSEYQEKPVDSSAASTYVLSKRLNSNLEKGRTDKGPADPAYSEYPRSGSLYASGDASAGGLIGQDSADSIATMACVKDWTIKYAEYIPAFHKKEGEKSAPSICIFCGLPGHTVSECSETSNYELHDLDRRLPILDRLWAQTNAIYCLRCLGKGHWGAECQLKELEASSMSQMKESKFSKEMHVQHHECFGSRQNTPFDKRTLIIGGNSRKVDQLRVQHNPGDAIPILVKDCSSKTLPSAWGMHSANNAEETNNQQGSSTPMHLGQNVLCRSSDLKKEGQFLPTEHSKWKFKLADSEGKPVGNMIAVRPVTLLARDDKALDDWHFGLAIPTAKVQYELKGGTSLVPMGILEMIESIRLSRADLFKWASHADINLSVKGFFLRLRFGKWEEELGGTGYRMACIRGVYLKASVEARKLSMLVDLGDMECTVDSQYVSNQGFTEAELAEWWRLSGKSVPQKRDLKAKYEERKAWII